MLSKRLKKFLQDFLPRLSGLFALLVTLYLIIAAPPPEIMKRHPFLFNLFTGGSEGFPLPGSQFEDFKKFIPKNAVVSLILDKGIDGDRDTELSYYDIQNYLCPTILNRKPVEKSAIVYCSNRTIADRRLNDAGYGWFLMLGDGKGVAVKKE